MSPTYISAIVAGLAFFLPKLGITAGSEELTAIVQSIIIAVSGIIILVRRYLKGDITIAGTIKK